jgi:hypothetical protein
MWHDLSQHVLAAFENAEKREKIRFNIKLKIHKKYWSNLLKKV